MRSRYKRKKTDIEQAFNRAVVQLQERHLPKEGRTSISCQSPDRSCRVRRIQEGTGRENGSVSSRNRCARRGDSQCSNTVYRGLQEVRLHERCVRVAIQYDFSHLQEHVSNFGAVSTQVRVTLWKEESFYMNKDKQYLVKLMRPEDS